MVKYNCRHDAGCCCWRYKELHLFDDESSRRRTTVMNATAWRRREWTTHSITYWLAEQLSTEQLVNAQLLMQPQCTGNLANCEHCCVMRGLAVYAATFIVRQHTDKRYWYSNFFLPRVVRFGRNFADYCGLVLDHPRQKKMTSCRFSRWLISAIWDFKGPVLGSLKSPCTTSYRSSIVTIALNCLVIEKIAFFAFWQQTDKLTNRQTNRRTNRWTAPTH